MLSLPKDAHLAQAVIGHEDKKLECGLIGKLFGLGNQAKINIAATIIIFLLLIGISYSLWPPKDAALTPIELWKILSPLITMPFGFIFGAKSD